MNRCPITYEEIEADRSYSNRGLSLLFRSLEDILPFPYSLEEQLQLASELATKISIQGVQPKLSARLDPKQRSFVAVEKNGQYILKPQNPLFSHLPENEDLTMKLASLAGLEVPFHGLARAKDDSLFYFIRRFDRHFDGRGRSEKIAVEDFAQLAGLSRDTKYSYSIEKIITLIDRYMTFPAVEKARFFRLVLFNFLTGNEDAHLKNYSVIFQNDTYRFSPCYDLLNSTLALGGEAAEESALPLKGKKSRFTGKDFLGYLARDRLELTAKVTNSISEELEAAVSPWKKVIEKSFLPFNRKEQYRNIVMERAGRLFG